jgi:hypothetical protein
MMRIAIKMMKRVSFTRSMSKKFWIKIQMMKEASHLKIKVIEIVRLEVHSNIAESNTESARSTLKSEHVPRTLEIEIRQSIERPGSTFAKSMSKNE